MILIFQIQIQRYGFFDMTQWNSGAIPKNTEDIYENNRGRQNKFIVYREYMEEISVKKLRDLIDSHWKEFETIM